ncbi:hypothetical protein, partial [Pseudomonas brenneri]|uniref:hypothetical protein n=1 Tax=Pseudomonas brenneri TaxID=129817 RepID=UPI001B86753E
CESRSSSRLNSETPIAKAVGVLFWALGKGLLQASSFQLQDSNITGQLAFYAMALRMAIMRASL